jgi:hypothetical protein
MQNILAYIKQLGRGFVEIDARSEHQEQRPDAVAPPDWSEQLPAPRGRPFVKGQSGNPAGRPSRAYQAAVVAEALIARKTVPLTNKLLELALAGDRAALRLCLERVAPPRREPPPGFQLPPIGCRADIPAALAAVADAAASGALTSTQSATLVRMLTEVFYALR